MLILVTMYKTTKMVIVVVLQINYIFTIILKEIFKIYVYNMKN